MDKIKITNHQLFALTASFACGSGPLVISASITSLAGQDAWISMLLTVVFGPLELWLICFLWSHYPGMTYVQMINKTFGKYIGSIITVGFAFFCLLTDSEVIHYIGDFMTIQEMHQTPAYLINTIFFIVIAIALLYGLEVIARSYEILTCFASLLFILSMILVLPNARIENLQPVFEKGIIPILEGSILLNSFFTFPVIILLMIFPTNADNTTKARKSFIKGYLWGGFLIFISILVSILVLGSTITADSQYPVYILAKEINVGVIFTRLEFIVAAVWIITLLSRAIIYFYAGIISIAQLLKLKDHKKIILPLGLIIVVMSGIVYTDDIYKSTWDTFVWPPFVATFGLILPIVMVTGFYIKKYALALERQDN
ncbi:Spore germination protein YndE [Clostridium ljungdahlii DSM 13528]|uniref:Spore germination protein KB n=1 Tax=Clostridium ljungdahlii (strain ATCC 55383 / DSM 13528 / PETC) TaxID=748727 RepID=D8GUQ4_CLOLD|nr:endospore germination permease [Clostridium ljungdahlii]ADK16931.1 spore germination protein KB [Clostridium ljungdahlii DSM 13528]OAA85308.1 Spore germination protein YndE [Clostridium ljungdahlii DSM 13528]